MGSALVFPYNYEPSCTAVKQHFEVGPVRPILEQGALLKF